MKRFNTWEIKWWDLIAIINVKVGTKVGTRIEIVVGNIGWVEIGEAWKWEKIDTCLPMIVHALRNQLGQKEDRLKTCL